MRNRKPVTNRIQAKPDTSFDGSSIALFIFVALSLWLLLFQSNVFR